MSVSIDIYLNTIKDKICANQNLCKLLYYDSDNPLIESDLSDTTVLYTDDLNQRLFFSPFSFEIVTTQKTTLNIIIDNFRPRGRVYYKNITLEFIVCVHKDLWILNDGTNNIVTRLALILDEINTIFTNKKNVGMGLDLLSSGEKFEVGKYHTGFKFALQFDDFTSV